MKDVKYMRKDHSKVPPPGRAPDDGLDDCIVKVLKKDPHPHLSTRKIAKALNINSATVRNHLTESFAMK
jgi:hypothetical protein